MYPFGCSFLICPAGWPVGWDWLLPGAYSSSSTLVQSASALGPTLLTTHELIGPSFVPVLMKHIYTEGLGIWIDYNLMLKKKLSKSAITNLFRPKDSLRIKYFQQQTN
jgi:hypothetical protein